VQYLKLTSMQHDHDWWPEYKWPKWSPVDPGLVASMSGHDTKKKSCAFFGLVSVVGLLAVGYLIFQDKRGY
jgi:hypothetical protein